MEAQRRGHATPQAGSPQLGRSPELARHILEGTGPFAPPQCQRLLQDADCVLSMEKRLNNFEKALCDAAEAHTKLDHWLKAVHTKFDQLQNGITEEAQAREALGFEFAKHRDRLDHVEILVEKTGQQQADGLEAVGTAQRELQRELHWELRRQLAAEASTREAHLEAQLGPLSQQWQGRLSEEQARHQARHAALMERMSALEHALGECNARLERELEGVRASHAETSAGVTRSHEAHQASWEGRFAQVERTLSETSTKQTNDVAAAYTQLSQLHERILEEQRARDVHFSSLRSHMAKDKHAHEALLSGVQERVACIESALGIERPQARPLPGDQAQPRRVQHGSVLQRLEDFDRALGALVNRHAKDLATVHSKIDGLWQSHTGLTREKENLSKALTEHQASVAENLNYLEGAIGSSADKHVQAAEALVRLDQLQEELAARLSGEREAREGAQASVHELLGREGQERNARHATLQERLECLERLLGDATDSHSQALQGHREAHLSHVDEVEQRLEQKLAQGLAALAERIGGDQRLQAQRHDAMEEHLADGKKAHAKLEAALQQHFAREQRTREVQESAVLEQVELERAARERHVEHILELLTQEKAGREKALVALQDQLEGERQAREAASRDVQELLSKERFVREQHRSTLEEALKKEQASRHGVEDLLAKEKVERFRQQETLAERVGLVQQTVKSFERLISKRAEERSAEAEQAWPGTHSRTQELSSPVSDTIADGRTLTVLDDSCGSTASTVASPSRLQWTGGAAPEAQSPSALSRLRTQPLRLDSESVAAPTGRTPLLPAPMAALDPEFIGAGPGGGSFRAPR